MSGFDSGQLVQLLTNGGVTTTKMLLEHPEKLASSIVVGTQVEGGTSETLRLVLTYCTSAAATQLLEKPASLVEAIQKEAETSSFDAGQ